MIYSPAELQEELVSFDQLRYSIAKACLKVKNPHKTLTFLLEGDIIIAISHHWEIYAYG